MSKAIKFPAIFIKATPKVDRSWKLEVVTRELRGEDVKLIGDAIGSEMWVIMAPNAEDIDNFQAPEEKADAGLGETKTLSQRLYNTLFAYWSYAGKPGDDFDNWRKQQMFKIMAIYKDKMPERSWNERK